MGVRYGDDDLLMSCRACAWAGGQCTRSDGVEAKHVRRDARTAAETEERESREKERADRNEWTVRWSAAAKRLRQNEAGNGVVLGGPGP